ncbi:MAG: AtpZ/AtpI family protein [Carbonactinosporaceae bacterium]
MSGQQPPDERPGLSLFALTSIGMLNALCLLAGVALGWLVDQHLGTTPVFIFVGMVLGIVAGVAGTYREIRKYLKD